MKKILIHAKTEKNLGDDIFIYYLCNRYPFVDFYVYYKDDCITLNKLSNLYILKNIELIKTIQFNLQIFIGGSIFMQSINKNILQKYRSDKKIRIQGVPTYIIGANFGPYQSKIFPLLYKHWFKNIDQIVFRDEYSYDLFQLNNMSWAPDILFNYCLPIVRTEKMVSISCIKKNFRSGLCDYNENVYFQKLAQIANKYCELGYSILLAAFCISQEDNIAAQMIYNLLSPCTKAKTEILIYQGDINEFLSNFLASSFIIGTRFHSIILGWSANIPVFPICYNSKLKNAIDSYCFTGNYAYINKMENITFAYVDFNRNKTTNIDIHHLKNSSRKHFILLDQILKEENNV